MRPALLTFASCLVVALSASCRLEPSAAGRPCADDVDCGGAFYCQLEIEPHVCLPGTSGVPPLPNRAPVLESALVVVAPGAHGSAAPSPFVVEGRFEASDPDGDGVRFVTREVDSPFGRLEVEADGAYRFTLASPPPLVDDAAVLSLELEDDRAPAARARNSVYVQHLAQGPSPFLLVWRGASSADFGEATNWQPDDEAPSRRRSVVLGPGAVGPAELQGGATTEVNGFISTPELELHLGPEGSPATLVAHGTRVLSGAPLGRGTFELGGDGGFGVDVVMVGHMPRLRLFEGARVPAPVFARGDVELLVGASPLALRASLLAAGDLLQSEEGAPLTLSHPDAVLRVDGDARLAAPGNRVELGLLYVGGDLVLEGKGATGGEASLTLTGARDGEQQRVVLADPPRVPFLDVYVERDAAVLFDSDLHVTAELHVAGALGVAPGAVVEADTVVLRPSMRALEGEHGLVRARRCFVAVRLERPSFVECGETLEPPPLPSDDAGVAPPDEDAGVPPSTCPPRTAGTTSDLIAHDLVLVSSTPPQPAAGQLSVAPPALGFSDTSAQVRTGGLDLQSDGALQFTPSGLEGRDEIPVTVGIDLGVGFADIAGCVQVRAVSTVGMNVLVGFLWDDPASWSLGRLPSEADTVFVPAADEPRTAAAEGGGPLLARSLLVASGAVLDLQGRELHVYNRLLVGGDLKTGAGGVRLLGNPSELAGRVERLRCGDGPVFLGGDVSLGELVSADGLPTEARCAFDLLDRRLAVSGDALLEVPLELEMEDRAATFHVGGAFSVPTLGGLLTSGELVLDGEVAVAEWSADATTDHQIYLRSPGPLALERLDYDGWLIIYAGEESADGVAPALVVRQGGHVEILSPFRPIDIEDGVLSVEVLNESALFDTSTPDNWSVSTCGFGGQHPICP